MDTSHKAGLTNLTEILHHVYISEICLSNPVKRDERALYGIIEQRSLKTTLFDNAEWCNGSTVDC